MAVTAGLEARARMLLWAGAIAATAGIAIAGTMNRVAGGVLLVAGWVVLVFGIHAFGRSGSSA